jgi:SAM-dependent MidA family methyltransferase
MKVFSNGLTEVFKTSIQKNGPLRFKDFMERCLYDEKFGYYAGLVIPVGKCGDFVTSPHASGLYGALQARQIDQFWNILGIRRFRIVEMGAGAGYLARDILSCMVKNPIGERLEYVIVEHMPRSVECQKKILGPFLDKVRWVEKLSDLAPAEGCVISNELLDAFPVHVVEKTPLGFSEVYVGLGGNGELAYVLGGLSSIELEAYVAALPTDLGVGYRTEVNLCMQSWIRDVSCVLLRGFVVTVDYGHTRKEYFLPGRNRGTLLAYRDQGVSESVLESPGEQDLTSHVNFTDLHRWGMDCGLKTLGYCPQWAFLGGLDFEEVFADYSEGGFHPFSPQLASVKALLFPQGMGETHKVMIQGKAVPGDVELKGLRMKNKIDRLEER